MANHPPPDRTVLLFELKKKYLVTNFIGLAMILSIFIYAGLVEIFKRGYLLPAPVQPAPEPLKSQVFYFALAGAAAIYFLLRFLNGRVAARMPHFLSQTAIASFALSEMVALIGFVLFLLFRDPFHFYALMGIALFYFYLFYPRYDRWEALTLPGQAPPKGREEG